MILSEGRTRLAKMLDDAANDRWDSTEIDDALKSGQLEAWQVAINGGDRSYNVEAAFSATAAGLVDLTSVKPKRIVSVYQFTNGERLLVEPIRFEEAPSNLALAAALRIVYVPTVSFPASAGAAFIWGHADIETALLDELMLLIAFSALKPKDAERDHFAERRVKLEQKVEEGPSGAQWSVLPLDSLSSNRQRHAAFGYVSTAPHKLQLVQV